MSRLLYLLSYVAAEPLAHPQFSIGGAPVSTVIGLV